MIYIWVKYRLAFKGVLKECFTQKLHPLTFNQVPEHFQQGFFHDVVIYAVICKYMN